MRRAVFGVAFAVVACLVAGVAIAQPPETATIDDCVNKKAAVEFPHAAHWEVTECTTCHHTQEGLTADNAEGVETCGSCHTEPEAAETPKCSEMSLTKNPFHIGCVNCHKEQAAGPTKCDECHPKAEG